MGDLLRDVIVRPVIFIAFVSMCACGATMSTYYKTVGTASVLVATGYRLLDAKDAETQTAIVTQAKTDPIAAKSALTAYLVKYNLARKSLTAASALVQDANNAAPVIELASNQSTQVLDWVTKLGILAADVVQSLQPLGITITIAGVNVTAIATTVAQ